MVPEGYDPSFRGGGLNIWGGFRLTRSDIVREGEVEVLYSRGVEREGDEILGWGDSDTKAKSYKQFWVLNEENGRQCQGQCTGTLTAGTNA